MKQIILASSSANRRTIFSMLNIPFSVKPADIDEKRIVEENVEKRVEKLAEMKAKKIAENEQAIVIAADTFTVCVSRVMERPRNKDEAEEMINFLSGKKATSYTGFCFISPFDNIHFTSVRKTDVKFRKFYPEEIKSYIEKFPVTSWAAGYAASELYVLGMIDEIRGSLTGFTHGLPLEDLIPLLEKSGFIPRV